MAGMNAERTEPPSRRECLYRPWKLVYNHRRKSALARWLVHGILQEQSMLKFYFNGSPNPTKVALFLEEAGLAYEPIAIDTRRGDQFNPEYLAVNPNAKVPAIDDDGVKVFDS